MKSGGKKSGRRKGWPAKSRLKGRGTGQKEEREKNSFKAGLAVFLIACALLAFLFWRQSKDLSALTAYGIKGWATVCEGEGRLYRLRSENIEGGSAIYGTGGKSLTNRNLQFLDEEGRILHFTNYFYKNSLDKDFVWRFKNTSGGLAAAMFEKAEGNKILYKILAGVFQSDYKKYKDKNPNKALKGDEIVFEIAGSLDRLSITLKGGKQASLLCRPV